MHTVHCLQVWSRLSTADVLAQAAANTVRPALNPSGPAYQTAVANGLDPQLLYDYRCRVLHMVKAHYGEYTQGCRKPDLVPVCRYWDGLLVQVEVSLDV